MQIQVKSTQLAFPNGALASGGENRGAYHEGSRLLWADSDLKGMNKEDRYAVCKEQAELWTMSVARMDDRHGGSDSASGSHLTGPSAGSRRIAVVPMTQ